MPQSQCNKHSGRRHVPTTTSLSVATAADIERINVPKKDPCFVGYECVVKIRLRSQILYFD